ARVDDQCLSADDGPANSGQNVAGSVPCSNRVESVTVVTCVLTEGYSDHDLGRAVPVYPGHVSAARRGDAGQGRLRVPDAGRRDRMGELVAGGRAGQGDR